MNNTANIARVLVRVCGVIQIVLGILFWTNNALALIPVHMLNGMIIVLLLWLLAALAAFSGVSWRTIALSAVGGFVVIVLGFNQARILPGDLHLVIEVLHLLVGLAALGMADALARTIKQARATKIQSESPSAV